MEEIKIFRFKEKLIEELNKEISLNLVIKEEYHSPSKSLIFSVRTINSPLLNFTFRVIGEESVNSEVVFKYIIITGLFIEPQNTGLGSRIMLVFISLAKTNLNIEKIYLNPKSLRAENFWYKLGFSEVSQREPLESYGYNRVKNIV